MYLSIFITLLGLTAALPTSSADNCSSQTAGALVNLGYSQYQGQTLGNGVNQYLGLRFAAPPIGELRWREPSDPLKTTGVQPATAFGPICLGISVSYPSSTQSEDCLYINVWAPANATIHSKLPVWFFIQGGGYISDSNPNFNGSEVVEVSGGNIVFVNMNYRVAAWGFLASEKVRDNGALNAGLLDQRKALEWVQKYISLFGGDPEHVVIHGASAGAGSVALHMTAYGGRDDRLFVGGIGESVFLPTQPLVSELEGQFDDFVSHAGCNGTADELACLRTRNTTVLQAANIPGIYKGATASPRFYYSPCIDGVFIEEYPYLLIKSGKFVHVPILFGNDNDEGVSFVSNATSPADVAVFMVDNFPKLSTNDTDAINAEYPLMAPVPKHAAYFPSLAAAYGESTFTCPGIAICQSWVQHVSPKTTWNYRVNILATNNVASGLGTPHTFELPAIFGPGYAGAASANSSFVTYNSEMVPIIMNYWISFVRALSPNVHKFASAPYWEPYSSKQRRIVLQTNATAMEDVPADQLARCRFWNGLAVTMEQ